mgnify:CR=1 FL=1
MMLFNTREKHIFPDLSQVFHRGMMPARMFGVLDGLQRQGHRYRLYGFVALFQFCDVPRIVRQSLLALRFAHWLTNVVRPFNR